MKRLFTACVFGVALLSPATNAQSSPYCQADLVFDNTLNFFDVSAFLDAYTQGDLLADFNGSGHLNYFDVSAFLELIANGCPDLSDADNDRIPDFAETDNGIFVDAFATGTDPFNPDTDGDSIDDGDEVLGTREGLVLPGASPSRKDLYIECDWFAGVFQGRAENYRPTPAVNTRITIAFADAPVENPYGLPGGITLHLDYGQGNGHEGGNQLPGAPVFIRFGSEFNQYKAEHFDPRRKGYYHYAIFANRYNSSTNRSSGVAEINGDDFMITMVDYNSISNMSNTIAHELGHNLGLLHGGFENRNRKPNYNSVMNYRHQFSGVDTTGNAIGNGVLDYSRGFNIDLNEIALLEADGVNGFNAIDWNRNGFTEPFVYSANINCNSPQTWQPCGVGTGCFDAACTILRDDDDWISINWNRLSHSTDRDERPELIECDNWPEK